MYGQTATIVSPSFRLKRFSIVGLRKIRREGTDYWAVTGNATLNTQANAANVANDSTGNATLNTQANVADDSTGEYVVDDSEMIMYDVDANGDGGEKECGFL